MSLPTDPATSTEIEPTGYVPRPYGKIAYWRVPGGSAAPLLCLHGGPGMPHDYLEPLARLSEAREIIFFDQAGCGFSSAARPPEWTVDRFVAEMAAVIDALDLNCFHLFGNSWGGWLALEYVLSAPSRPPTALVLSSSPPSVRRWVADMIALRAALPERVRAKLDQHEAAGTTDSREYRQALGVFNRRHMCRTQPWPEALKRAIRGFGVEAYHELWGASEFGPITGALADWDVTDRLGDIRLPTLVTGGRHDEATPEHLRLLADGIPGAQFEIFEASSHMAFLEEPDSYLATVTTFLRDADASPPRKGVTNA